MVHCSYHSQTHYIITHCISPTHKPLINPNVLYLQAQVYNSQAKMVAQWCQCKDGMCLRQVPTNASPVPCTHKEGSPHEHRQVIILRMMEEEQLL